MHSLHSAAALAAICLASGVAAQTSGQFKAFNDSSCKNQIDPNWDLKDLAGGKMTIDLSQNAWPDAKTFEDITFPGAQTDGSAGSIVYWDLPELQPGQRWVLMLEWPAEGNYGKVGGNQGYGMVVMDVGEPGCYWSSILEGQSTIFWSTCTGTDCQYYSAGNTALDVRELPPTTLSKEVKRAAPTPAVEAEVSKRDDPSDFDFSECAVKSQDGPWTTSGIQTMVGPAQDCSAGGTTGCSFSAASGKMNGSSITTSTDQTITNSVGASIDIKTGVDFIAEADVTVGANYQFSSAIGKSTGQTVTNTSTWTFTNQLSQPGGTRAFVTFVPTYECFTVTVDCGGGESQPIDMCTVGDNQGNYQIVTTN